ncbi:hypothetical protein LTR91_025555 [Friedmanniomyces endolithicus]|uniref:Uncharacterized protein n=1 Tax=Friedmanniomyces endolithicus TaxID=329885 RepID=A0AAN6GZP9_9PEZI|nr:hypothetical protein LTR91_025555 [Friedmanniomyces endolithicus]
MTSPSESIIVALAASATIERDDDVGFISIPGIEVVCSDWYQAIWTLMPSGRDFSPSPRLL